jgi:DNA-binding MarR family transcriptional regulator
MTRRVKNDDVHALKTFRNLMAFRLHRVGGRSERLSENFYRERFNLNLPECRVIGITGGYSTAAFKRICQDANLEKSYASRIINRLVERGFLEKIGDPSDQRAVIVRLTEEGRKLHSDLHGAAAELNLQLCSALSPEQLRTFMASLLLLDDRLSEIEEHGLPSAVPESAPRHVHEDQDIAPDDVMVDQATAEQLYQLLGRMLKRTG